MKRSYFYGTRFLWNLTLCCYYAEETEQSYALLAGELFDKYGVPDALIWITLEDPLLIGYILKDFTDNHVLRKWMHGEFHQ